MTIPFPSRIGVPTSRSISTALPRPRLFDMLGQEPDLAIVQAPSGFGKTTLVATWLHAGGSPDREVIWIDGPALDGPALPDVLRATLDARPDRTAPCLLVLNGVDSSRAGPALVTVVDLIEQCALTAAVVCVHGAVELPLSAMTDGIRCVSLRADDLVFTADETLALCRSAETELTEPQCQDLCAKLRGIPALVSSAASLLRTFPGPPIDENGRLTPVLRRLLDEYTDERLSELDHDTRTHAVTVAASRNPSPSEVTELTGVEASEQLLERMDAAGLLVGTYDGGSRSWSWPDAIRQAVLDISRRERPGHVDELMARLAYRSLDAGRFADAAGYAADASEWPVAIRIVEKHWSDMVAGHFELLVQILRMLPAEVADDHPPVAAGKALFVHTVIGHPLLNQPIPTGAAELTALGADPVAAQMLHIGTVQSVALRMAGSLREGSERAGHMVSLADSMLANQPDNVTPQLPTVQLQWAISMQLAGDLEPATVQFERAYRGAHTARFDFVVLNAAGSIALNWALLGDLPRTREWLRAEARVDTSVGYWDEMIRVGGRAAAALADLDRLDFDGARSFLDLLGTPKSREELWGFVTYAGAQHALATGDPYGGLALLHRNLVGHRSLHQPGGASHVLLTAAEIDLNLALGNSTVARSLAPRDLGVHPLVLVSVSRMELLTGHPETARQVLAQVSWARSGWLRAHIEALLIEAASYLDDHPELATRAWNRACTLAGPLGNRRAFTTLPGRYIESLSALSGTAVPGGPVPSVFPDAVAEVTLSPRELTVLERLAAGTSPKSIAAELFVSPNTVKTQLRSIYRKLDVHSGTEAVTRARELRLLGRS
ncbi:helix-turn-helix transcriptional regulator [Rhodococcus sp. ABRD24]|uniref:helix-turn-helix transcriptional regulator n=1 Tax=Rhodococcus sp. ABRD24 TaxID=2507582 RepID=UPI001038B76A|nr:LuxR C-terminal-related transcriptional regulator [Rhodococcus sp. ABRD24]QBJ96744.1 helix-turn-helix transcriptional regulator [Rhodococcus sp. ABRD24]